MSRTSTVALAPATGSELQVASAMVVAVVRCTSPVASERDGGAVEERLQRELGRAGVVLGLRAAQDQHLGLVGTRAGGGEAGRGIGGAVGGRGAAQDGGAADEHVAGVGVPSASAATQRSVPLNGVAGTAGTLPASIASAAPVAGAPGDRLLRREAQPEVAGRARHQAAVDVDAAHGLRRAPVLVRRISVSTLWPRRR